MKKTLLILTCFFSFNALAADLDYWTKHPKERRVFLQECRKNGTKNKECDLANRAEIASLGSGKFILPKPKTSK